MTAPKPNRDGVWDACGCPNPDDCEHVYCAPKPGPLDVDDVFREAMRLLRNCCYTPIRGARNARRFCMETDTEQVIAAAQKAREEKT